MMRFLVFFISMISLGQHLCGEEITKDSMESIELLKQSPMIFSKGLPVDISQKNKQIYINNPQLWDKEAEEGRAFIRNKSLPWLPLTSVLATLLTIYYIRMLPAREIKAEMDPLTKQKAIAEIRANLQKIVMRKPNNESEAKTSIMQMNSLLRMYLHYLYAIPAFSYTTPELKDMINDLPDFDAAFKETVGKLFEKADRIKYAKEKAAPEEFTLLVSDFFIKN